MPTLAHFSGQAPTFVSCGSGFAVGVVLSQKVGGVEQTVAFCPEHCRIWKRSILSVKERR